MGAGNSEAHMTGTDENDSANESATADEVYRDALETLILSAIIAKEARQDTEHRLKGFGAEFTAPQYRLLRQLQQSGHATIKELSRSMMVEPATLVPMVDSLERHGLIRRGADPRDRRRTPLELTDAGRAQLSQVPYIHEDDLIARYLRQLPADERQTFLGHLRDLVKTLHGHDEGVRHVSDAVNAYFAFGQISEGRSEEQRRPARRRTQRARPTPEKEVSS